MRSAIVVLTLLLANSTPVIGADSNSRYERYLRTLDGVNDVKVDVKYLNGPPSRTSVSEEEVARLVVGRLRDAGCAAQVTTAWTAGDWTGEADDSLLLILVTFDVRGAGVEASVGLKQRATLVRKPTEWFIATISSPFPCGGSLPLALHVRHRASI